MLYEVITLDVAVHRSGPRGSSEPAGATGELEVIVELGIESGPGGRHDLSRDVPDVELVPVRVITSYSIHYTKLYDEDRSMCE